MLLYFLCFFIPINDNTTMQKILLNLDHFDFFHLEVNKFNNKQIAQLLAAFINGFI